MNNFLGRETELAILRGLKEKTASSFVVVMGRRRIGKSRIVREFSKFFNRFYLFEGLSPEEDIQKLRAQKRKKEQF